MFAVTVTMIPNQTMNFLFVDDLSYLWSVTYPPAPTTFDELIQLIPPRGSMNTYRFLAADKPFELQIGRNSSNIVFMNFCVPEEPWTFWPCIRKVESLTSQRAMWLHWQKFLENPDCYLTWKYIGRPLDEPERNDILQT